MADEECKHPVQLFGMCAVCGKPLDADSEEQASLSVMHSNASVKVSAEEAQRLDSETTSHLLSQRKLALIVDLDQTVIHATVDPTVGEWMKDETNPNYEALKSVGKFRLGIDGEEIKDDDDENAPPKDSAAALRASRACWYYVKPRPGLSKFLKELSEKYELHVYTMGTRSYANCVCKLIDPDASIFGNRILSRDENGSLVRKSLSRLFPVDQSMVVIIDDREDVWNRSPNLLPVLPYEFFVGIGDINATFLPTPPPPPGAIPPEVVASTSATKLDDAASHASTTASDASGASPADTPKTAVEDAEAGSAGATEEELQAVREAAAHFAAQTEKLQSKLAEQREARPLAKMQEALDVKLGRNGASRSGTVTPNGNAEPPAGDGSSSSSSSSETPSGESSSETPTAVVAAPAIEANPETTSTSTAISPPSTGPPPLPPPPPPLDAHRSGAVLVDDDTELDRIYTILSDLHSSWYAEYDAMQAHPKPQSASDPTVQKPSVVDLIGAKKAQVLSGCVIVFSSMIPFGHDVERSELWTMAREFGAVPAAEIVADQTSHVVAARPGTAKVHQALRLAKQSAGQGGSGLEVVWPSWFHVSASRWKRQDEKLYRISVSENAIAAASAGEQAKDKERERERERVGEEAKLANEAEEAKEAGAEEGEGEALFESELNDMDWGAAADEVDAYLDSATTASNISSPSPSTFGIEAEMPEVEPLDAAASVSRKRARTENDDDEGDGGGKDVNEKDFALDSAATSKKPRAEAANDEENDEDDDDDAGDSFLDDLAQELDGQLDNE